MSSTVPSFLSGMEAAIERSYSGPSAIKPSVRMLPGSTALMVMPYLANSMQAVRMNPSWPALVAP